MEMDTRPKLGQEHLTKLHRKIVSGSETDQYLENWWTLKESKLGISYLDKTGIDKGNNVAEFEILVDGYLSGTFEKYFYFFEILA